MAEAVTDSPRARSKAREFHIEENWKGVEGSFALLHGDRLVTRSHDREQLERFLADQQAKGKKIFSSKVAPIEDLEEFDED